MQGVLEVLKAHIVNHCVYNVKFHKKNVQMQIAKEISNAGKHFIDLSMKYAIYAQSFVDDCIQVT